MIRFKEQSRYQDKSDIKAWWCRSHVVAETVILKLLAKARRRIGNTNIVEVFDSTIIGRNTAELAIKEVVKEIKKNMKKEDEAYNGIKKLLDTDGSTKKRLFMAQPTGPEDPQTTGPKDIQPAERGKVTYDGEPIPEGGWATDGTTVYRGDVGLLDLHLEFESDSNLDLKGKYQKMYQKTVFKEGIEPKTEKLDLDNVADVYEHIEDGNAGENFVSTSLSEDIAKSFSTKRDAPLGSNGAFAKIWCESGVDVVKVHELLEKMSPPKEYLKAPVAAQRVISILGGIPGHLIKWIRITINGEPIQIDNSNFAPLIEDNIN